MTQAHATTAPDATPASGAARLAEQSLLGALLRDPDLIAHVSAWLTPTDFADPAHHAVYTALLQRSTGTTPGLAATSPLAVLVDIQARLTEHPGHPGSLAGISVTGLLVALRDASLPTTTAAHATRYGRIVLHDSIRRQLHAWGARLEHAAASADPEHAIRATTADMLAAVNNLTATDRAETSDPLTSTIAPARPTTAPSPATPPATTDPAASPAAPAPVPRLLVERAERHIIHAVLTTPGQQTDAILQRLQPDDFHAHPAHAPTWRAIHQLHDAGEPIDPTLLAWHVETAGSAARATAATAAVDAVGVPGNDTGLSAEQLADMRCPPLGDTDPALTTITRAALINHARKTQSELATAATSRSTGAMLAAAATAVGQLERNAQRLTNQRTSASLITLALGTSEPRMPGSRSSKPVVPRDGTARHHR